MTRDSDQPTSGGGLHRPHASAALRVSAVSVVWTVVSSSAAIVLGLRSDTSVLVAFGAIGFVDAVGSVALVYHFQHGLRHDEMSDHIEKLAHRIVLVGLLVIGAGAVASGLTRLSATPSAEGGVAAAALAATSLVALTALSVRKQSIARRVSSPALLSDGHLSAIGATQAAVALAGTGVTERFNWNWADAVATTLVGCIAVTLAVVTWKGERRRR